ncbi:MAG: metallophosphoesterase [Pyrinomonadaceae bacterium]
MSRLFKSKLRITFAAALAALAILAAWAFWLEPASLTVRRVSLVVPGWRAEHAGLKVALLTDLHVGAPHMSLGRLRRVVERTNAEAPDVVLITGDFVIGGPKDKEGERGGVAGGTFVEPEPIAGELKHLRAPLGVYAVLGNHDWWFDGERITRALEGAGLRVLENGAARVERGGHTLWLAGVADLWTRRPDVETALREVPAGDPVILFTHNPDIFPTVPARVSLTVAGHTHGGQVNLPLFGRPVVPSRFGQRYAFGHVEEGGRHLYVGGGVGTSIVPVRFRVPPEVVVLSLEVER